jgi:PKD repeat protein
VTLTATNAYGSDGDTKTNYITVNPCVTPTAGFVGSPTSGDYPLNVNFTNQSSGATSYSWTFGDGGTSTATNPSHTYTSAGTFTVALTATNSCGSDQQVRTNYITVTTPPCDPPVADFSGSPTSGNYPLNVNFTDLSTNSPTSWSWTFGDGGTSTAQNPSHTYTAAGTYTVSMTATNACGSDGVTKTGYISVTQPTVAYAAPPYSTGFESGAFDQYWFTQSSNSEGRILITTANGPHSGSYHMTMDDNLNGGQYSQNEAWLRLNLSGLGNVDLTFWWKEFADEDHTQDGVFLSDNGGGSFVKVYSLTGGSSTYQQIALDIDQLAASNGLSMNSTFVVKFQQYDNYGIATDGMAFDDISVVSNDVPPVAAFVGSPTSGSFPLNVSFTDQSSGAPTSWSWNFGDGGTSTAQNPSHTYTSAGTYTVTLTASNAFGSDDEVKTNYITVTTPPPPTAAFVGNPTSGTIPFAVSFTDQSTGNPTSWSWNFGDGGTSTAQSPSHTYTVAGTYTVTLTATNAYGSDNEVKTGYITANEPSASTVITFDDFESGFGNYTDGGGDCSWYRRTTYAWSGRGAADIQDNSGVASSFYHTGSYNVSGFGTLEVEFYFIAISMDNPNEDFWVQYYDGSSWNTVAALAEGTDFDNGVFYNVVVTIPSSGYNFPSNAKLRFMCDASGNQDDVYIDDIEWRGLSTVSSAPGLHLLAASEPIKGLVKETSAIPSDYSLTQNYPNPFNAGTNIVFGLPEAGQVDLTVYNILGQAVRSLASGEYPEGTHTIHFDGRDNSGQSLASGMYFYRLTTSALTETKKMILLK